MTETINLMQIVRQTFESELDVFTGDKYKEELKKKYDYCSDKLREVLIAVHFDPDLLKENGEYKIPRQDGEFIQWILEHYTNESMKQIRKGDFPKADMQFMYTFMKGLDDLLSHLDMDDNRRTASRYILRERTKYDENIRIFNIQVEFYKMLNNTANILSFPTFRLTYEDRMDCLEAIADLTKRYSDEVKSICGDIVNRRKEIIKKNSYPITLEEFTFSERFTKIHERLQGNEEFCRLQEEINALKHNHDFLNKNEKKRIKVVKRIKEIIKEVSDDYPIDVENLTTIERLMMLSDTPFVVHFSNGEGSIEFTDDVSSFERIYSMIW